MSPGKRLFLFHLYGRMLFRKQEVSLIVLDQMSLHERYSK